MLPAEIAQQLRERPDVHGGFGFELQAWERRKVGLVEPSASRQGQDLALVANAAQ
jgi:hypothetical protein